MKIFCITWNVNLQELKIRLVHFLPDWAANGRVCERLRLFGRYTSLITPGLRVHWIKNSFPFNHEQQLKRQSFPLFIISKWEHRTAGLYGGAPLTQVSPRRCRLPFMNSLTATVDHSETNYWGESKGAEIQREFRRGL